MDTALAHRARDGRLRTCRGHVWLPEFKQAATKICARSEVRIGLCILQALAVDGSPGTTFAGLGMNMLLAGLHLQSSYPKIEAVSIRP